MNILNALQQFFLAPTYKDDPEKELDAKTTHRVSVMLLVLAIPAIPLIFLLESPTKGICSFRQPSLAFLSGSLRSVLLSVENAPKPK